jgi:hypothetical protein
MIVSPPKKTLRRSIWKENAVFLTKVMAAEIQTLLMAKQESSKGLLGTWRRWRVCIKDLKKDGGP